MCKLIVSKWTWRQKINSMIIEQKRRYPCTFVVTYCTVAIICTFYGADAAAADNKFHAAAADKNCSARHRRRWQIGQTPSPTIRVSAHRSIPNVISSNRRSNFTSFFLRWLGRWPRFNTPVHPEVTGLVEHCNLSFMSFITVILGHAWLIQGADRIRQHQLMDGPVDVSIARPSQRWHVSGYPNGAWMPRVLIDWLIDWLIDPRTWHRLASFVWSLREVPNSTTNISPHTLLHGTLPIGLLTALTVSWEGGRETPLRAGNKTRRMPSRVEGKCGKGQSLCKNPCLARAETLCRAI